MSRAKVFIKRHIAFLEETIQGHTEELVHNQARAKFFSGDNSSIRTKIMDAQALIAELRGIVNESR